MYLQYTQKKLFFDAKVKFDKLLFFSVFHSPSLRITMVTFSLLSLLLPSDKQVRARHVHLKYRHKSVGIRLRISIG